MTHVSDSAIELPAIDQIGIVVEDVEDGMRRCASVLGIEPWLGFEFTAETLSDATYRGRRVDHGFRLAIADVGGLDVELIEPLVEPSIYDDHLEAHGEGIHHVAYYARDDVELETFVEAFDRLDVPVVQRGVYEGTTYVYFDTRSKLNGVMVEVVDRRGIDDRDPAFRYPPNG
jgi:hypothetical protein